MLGPTITRPWLWRQGGVDKKHVTNMAQGEAVFDCGFMKVWPQEGVFRLYRLGFHED